jgi:hypothetical protein
MDQNELINVIIDRHEATYKGDGQYKNAIRHMAVINLAEMTETIVGDVVEEFLYNWGRMGRVLGQMQYLGWQSNVAEILKTNSETLKQFQRRNIETENLDNHKTEIVRLYESLKKATGKIASAKILNLICPDFFPLWDNAIADAVRAELAILQGLEFEKNIEAFSGEDYFRFVVGIKLFMTRHDEMISHLSIQNGQKKLRIVDQCFWWMVRRPLSLVF